MTKRIIDLLSAVQETGSISKAAKQAGISYKTAWKTIEELNTASETPLTVRCAGGKGGGGTRLTERGLILFRQLEKASRLHSSFLSRLEEMLDGTHRFEILQGFLENISAGVNIFDAVVQKTQSSGGRVIAELETESGLILTGISNEAVREADDVQVMISPKDIILIKGAKDVLISARNILSGKVEDIITDGGRCTVTISVQNEQLSAVITETAAKNLNIEYADEITAIFKAASTVVINK